MNELIKTENFFESWDGTNLFYRTWAPKNPSKKAVILMHRGHEHSGRLHDLVEGLELDDFWAFAYDARGHGMSPGPRGYAENFAALVQDLDSFSRMIQETHNILEENIVVVADSVGAVVTSAWVHDYAPNIRSMVLAAPAFSIKLYIPGALPGLKLLNQIKSKAFISSYVKSKMLTHDKEEAERYANDPLITRDISVNILTELFDTSKRIIEDAGAITTPTLILSAGKDWVVRNSAQREFFDGLSTRHKKMLVYPNFFHGVMYEMDKQKPFAEARKFILDSFNREVDQVSLINADQKGYTKKEYETLQDDLPFLKYWKYNITVKSMKTLGKLSDGIRLGLETGFDSGRSLDHVYRNKASGVTWLGRIIDYIYINSVGWKGIRIRKRHLKGMLNKAIAEQAYRGEKPRIMDIAAGPGRYVTESVLEHADKGATALICDNEQGNIDQGKVIAEELNCTDVSFKVHDAFNPESYETCDFKPNIVIISGLFELFPSNEMISRAIEGAMSLLAEGGTLVYTGQPWHPQLEMIAHTLSNRVGEAWVMRRRTQRELDQLFAKYGLNKQQTVIDQYGIFTVSMGKKAHNYTQIETITKDLNNKEHSTKVA